VTKTVQPFHILTSAMSTVRRSSDQSPTSANKDDLPTSHLLLRLRQHLKLNVVVRRSHLRRDSAWKAETSSVPIIGLISTFSAAKSRTNFIVSSHFRCVLDDSIGEDEKMRLSLYAYLLTANSKRYGRLLAVSGCRRRRRQMDSADLR